MRSYRFTIVYIHSRNIYMIVHNGGEFLTTPYKDCAEYLCNLLNAQPEGE